MCAIPWQQKCPALFEGLDCLSAIEDCLSYPPLNRIPLAVYDGVMAELWQLLDIGITEPVDNSPWVSNLVVVKKVRCSVYSFHQYSAVHTRQ